MERKFICPVCGNSKQEFIATFKFVPYCTKCFCVKNGLLVSLRKKNASPPKKGEEKNSIEDVPEETPPLSQKGKKAYVPDSFLRLDYELSDEQKSLSQRIIDNYVAGKDSLLYAVCGSGKTEVSYGLLDYALKNGLTAGFALPRRDVVIELHQRLVKAFPSKKVVAVYGGHVAEKEGDIIVLTTHQLIRYSNYFDVLIMDEVDAFPYAGNKELEDAFHESLRGHCLLMSAAPSTELVKEFSDDNHDILMMHTRFHQQPIPVPRPVYIHGPNKFQFLNDKVDYYYKQKKPLFIFVPSIPQAESLYRVLSIKPARGNYVTSKRPDKEAVIADFREGRYDYLVTTAILERGVTVKNLNVIVFGAANGIYDAATLVQIAGRAGRKSDAPHGDVFFIADRETAAIKKAISEIRYCNTFLSNLSEPD